MNRPTIRPDTPPSVLLRDVLIFHVKLFMDGAKDIVLSPLSIVAAAADIVLPAVFPRMRRGRLFYSVLRVGERFDLWLNLFGSANHAEDNRDGLFGESRAGDDTLLGELEELVRRKETMPPVRSASTNLPR